MRAGLMAAVAVAASVMAGSASAQSGDFVQTFASGMEEVGQSLGQAAFAGPSLFVTAKGHARLPAPVADAYFITVEAQDPSAVAAARSRDAKVAELVAQGRRLGVDIEQGQTGIAYEVDAKAQQNANAERIARLQARAQPGAAPVPVEVPEPGKVFVARASLRFRAPPGRDAAAFLDAAHAAGVEEISHGVSGPMNPFLHPGTEAFGFGQLDSLDDSLWSAAGADALGHARAQAQALAASAGRTLGPVRSVIVLSRAVEGGEAVESLAVRFAFAELPR